MNNKINLLLLIIFSVFIFSCSENDPEPVYIEHGVSYIINYGDYAGAKSTITAFDKETGTVTNNYYENVNSVALVSNIQHAFSYNGKIYMLGNNPDELLWVDGKTFVQTENGVSADIVKPRFGVAASNYLYISCWGGDIWADESVSYIAKFNLSTKQVEGKIALPGGPEGMAVADNKLYAALNYKDSVAVINLSNDQISYIATPAVTSYFVKDKRDNLYVSLVSTFSDFSENTGLGYINTNTDALEATYQLDGVSTSYVNILAPNTDFTKLYVMSSAYDANWNLSGAIAVFDTGTKSFEGENLVEGISGLNGIAWYNDEVFSFIAESVTADGSAKTYKPDGTFVREFATGKAPYLLLTTD